MKKDKISQEILEYQPDATEIEEKPVPGKVRWVLYLIIGGFIAVIIGSIIFSIDRIVVSEGKLITRSPMIVVQPLNTASIRSVLVKIGDVVEKDQLLATLDSTFVGADLNQLNKRYLSLKTQLRRIHAELQNKSFVANPEEGEYGKLQQDIFKQRIVIFNKNKEMNENKIATLKSKLSLNSVLSKGKNKQLKLLRDVEGNTAKLPNNGAEYRLNLLQAQKSRFLTYNEIKALKAERMVINNELKQVYSEWQRFIEDRTGDLMKEEVTLQDEFDKVSEERNKAMRTNELVYLRAPQKGVVLSMAKRSIGSIIKQAEPFITLVPFDSVIEAEVNVKAKDIARIRVGDLVRVKLEAFPFQRHDTLPGVIRVISEDSFKQNSAYNYDEQESKENISGAYYRVNIKLLSQKLRNVPEGFRLMPGMKTRAEIKVGKRKVISYFAYPIIRSLDESLREP